MAWLRLTLSSPVLGSLQTLPDAGQAPARPRLPAARAPAPDPPLHPGADALLGCALDPQVHSGRHHLPSHGKMGTGFSFLLCRFSQGRRPRGDPPQSPPRWPDSLGVTKAGTDQDSGCDSRPDGAGGLVVEWRGLEGAEVVCGGWTL